MKKGFDTMKLGNSLLAIIVVIIMCAGAFIGAAQDNAAGGDSNAVDALLPQNSDAQTSEKKRIDTTTPEDEQDEEYVEPIVPEIDEKTGPWPEDESIVDPGLILPMDSDIPENIGAQDVKNDLTPSTEGNSLSTGLNQISEKLSPEEIFSAPLGPPAPLSTLEIVIGADNDNNDGHANGYIYKPSSGTNYYSRDNDYMYNYQSTYERRGWTVYDLSDLTQYKGVKINSVQFWWRTDYRYRVSQLDFWSMKSTPYDTSTASTAQGWFNEIGGVGSRKLATFNFTGYSSSTNADVFGTMSTGGVNWLNSKLINNDYDVAVGADISKLYSTYTSGYIYCLDVRLKLNITYTGMPDERKGELAVGDDLSGYVYRTYTKYDIGRIYTSGTTYRGFATWDPAMIKSLIPSAGPGGEKVILTGISVRINSEYGYLNNFAVYPMSNDPKTATASTIYSDAASGTPYVKPAYAYLSVAHEYEWDLGANALNDFNKSLSGTPKFFALGFTQSSYNYLYSPKLVIKWKIMLPPQKSIQLGADNPEKAGQANGYSYKSGSYYQCYTQFYAQARRYSSGAERRGWVTFDLQDLNLWPGMKVKKAELLIHNYRIYYANIIKFTNLTTTPYNYPGSTTSKKVFDESGSGGTIIGEYTNPSLSDSTYKTIKVDLNSAAVTAINNKLNSSSTYKTFGVGMYVDKLHTGYTTGYMQWHDIRLRVSFEFSDELKSSNKGKGVAFGDDWSGQAYNYTSPLYNPYGYWYIRQSGSYEYRNFAQWDIAQISRAFDKTNLSFIKIKKLSLRFNHLRNSKPGIDVYQMTKNVTSASASDIYADCGDGTKYYSSGSTSSSYNEYNWDLGTGGVTDFQNAIEDGSPEFFGVGITTTSTSGYAYDFSPKLVIEFEYPGPAVIAKLVNELPEGFEGTPTMFNASDSRNLTGGTGGLRYEWDWQNDGVFDENSTNPVAYYKWPDEGIYSIILRVNDTNSGKNASKAYNVTIHNADPKCNRTNFKILPQPAYEASTVTFTGMRVDDPGIYDSWKYFWDFDGDGVYDKWGNCTGNLIPNETWYYNDVFLGDAILLIKDNDGGSTNITEPHNIIATPPSSGTGYVYNFGSKYTSSSIYYHWSYTYDYRRGWAKFDLSEIPKDGVITKMVFKGTVGYNYSNGVDMFGVHLLTSDPTTASGSIVYNEAGDNVRMFGLTGSVGDKEKDLTKWVTTYIKANVTQAVKDGWIAFGFDFESPKSGYRYGYMRGYGYNLPKLEIEYVTTRPGCYVPVRVLDVAPVVNCNNLTITPTIVNEGEIISISNISFCDPGNDTYEAKFVIGNTFETSWFPLGDPRGGGKGGVVINEVYTGGSDWVELYNYGPDRDMTGWTLHCDEYPSQGLTSYTFPSFILNRYAFVQIHETSGTNDADDLYIGRNIYWNDGGPASCVSLLDASKNVVDYVPWNGYDSNPNPSVPKHSWTGSLQQSSNTDDIYRISDIDTDSSSDWKLGPGSSVTAKVLNPGQTGKGAPGGGNMSQGWGAYGPGCHNVKETFNVTVPDDFPASGTSWDDVTVTVYIRDDDDHKLIPGTGIGGRIVPATIHPNAYYSYGGLNGRKVVVDENYNIYAIFVNRQTSPYQIFIGKSSDNGESWDHYEVSSASNFSSYSQYEPALTIDSNGVLHAVWRGYYSGLTGYHIRYANSKDDGETWGDFKDLTHTGYGYNYDPAVAVDKNDNIHITWRGYGEGGSSPYKIWYMKRTSGGNWKKPFQISENLASYNPDIAADSKGNVHIVWRGYLPSISYYNIRHRMYWASNDTWSGVTNVTADTGSPAYHLYPSIAFDSSDNVHLAWSGRDSVMTVSYNIMYAKFTASSGKWSTREYVTKVTSGYPYHNAPSIAVNNADEIDVVWYGYQSPSWTSPYAIHHAEKVGGTWNVNYNLLSSGQVQYYPNLLWSYPNSIAKKGFSFVWYDYYYPYKLWMSDDFGFGNPEFTDGLAWCNDTVRVNNIAPKIDLNATFVSPSIVKEQEPFVFHTEFEDPAAGVFTEEFEYNLTFSSGQYSGWQPVTQFREGQPAGWTEITLKPNADDGKDAYIYDVSTSTSYQNYNYGTYIYSYLRGYMSGSTNYKARSLIEWDLTKIPKGYDLANATMRLYFGYKGTPSGTRTLYWYPITESWVEGTKSGSTASPGEVTWNNQPKYNGTSMASYTWAYGSGWIDFSLDIDVVEGWINNPTNNYGMLCKFGSEVGSYLYGYYRNSDYGTSSYHPELILEFEDPMPAILPRGIIEEAFMMPDDHPDTGTPWDIVDIKIQIKDDDLGTDETSTNMTVNNVPPEVYEGKITPKDLEMVGIDEGTLVTLEGFKFNDVAYDVPTEFNYGFNYSVDWGDGTPQTPWMNDFEYTSNAGEAYMVKDGAYSSSSRFASGRKMVMDSNNNMYVVYHGYPSPYQIYVAKSTDIGETWTEYEITTDSASTGQYQYYPSIAIDSKDVLHVVWQGNVLGYYSYQIRYANSVDGGETWGNFKMVTTGTAYPHYSYAASIAVDTKDTVHIVWYGRSSTNSASYNIQYINRNTSGVWSAIKWITTDTVSRYHYYPSIATDSEDNVHVVWYGRTSWTTRYNIQYRKFNASSGKWEPRVMLTNSTVDYQYDPVIAVDLDDNIHVTWRGYPSPYKIKYIRWDSTTETWGIIEQVSDNTYYNYYPTIGVDQRGYTYIMWYKSTGGYEIMMAMNDTTGWSKETELTTHSMFTSTTYYANIMYGGQNSIAPKGVCTVFVANVGGYKEFWASTDDFYLGEGIGPQRGIPKLEHFYRDDNPSNTNSDMYNITLMVRDDDTGIGTWETSFQIRNIWPTMDKTGLNTTLIGTESGLYTPEIPFSDPGTGPTETWSYWLDVDDSETLTAADLTGPITTVTEINNMTYGVIPQILTPYNDDCTGEVGLYLYDDDLTSAQTFINYSLSKSIIYEELDFETGTTYGPWDNWRNTGTSSTYYWRRHSGSTSSSSTGPSAAANGTTYYAYTEASGSGYPSRIFTLERSYMNFSNVTGMEFYYHMYGSTMGSLYLEIMTEESWVTLWSKSGNQGTSWFRQKIDLSSITQTGIIRFRGITGSSYRSDMAIDEIKFFSKYYFEPLDAKEKFSYTALNVVPEIIFPSESITTVVGEPFEIEFSLEDDGSDDLTYKYDFANGKPAVEVGPFYNDGNNPDIYPSALSGTAPFIVEQKIQHTFSHAGEHILNISIWDDDMAMTHAYMNYSLEIKVLGPKDLKEEAIKLLEPLVPGHSDTIGYRNFTLKYLGSWWDWKWISEEEESSKNKESYKHITVLAYNVVDQGLLGWEMKLIYTYCNVSIGEEIVVDASKLPAGMFGDKVVLKAYDSKFQLIAEAEIPTAWSCLFKLKEGQKYGDKKVTWLVTDVGEVNGTTYHHYSRIALEVEDAIDNILFSINKDPRRGYGWWHNHWVFYCGYWYTRELWVDDSRLDPEYGTIVFCEERYAVLHLMTVINNCMKTDGIVNMTFRWTGTQKVDIEVYQYKTWWVWWGEWELSHVFNETNQNDTFTVDNDGPVEFGKLKPRTLIKVYKYDTGELLDAIFIRTSGYWPLEVEPGNMYGLLEIADVNFKSENGEIWRAWFGDWSWLDYFDWQVSRCGCDNEEDPEEEEEYEGYEGCSHGFWKNHEEDEYWDPTGYATDDLLGDIFDIPEYFNEFADDSLLTALKYQGDESLKGAARVLLMQAVAALLNSAHPNVNYSYSEDDIIDEVNDALASKNRKEILGLKTDLDDNNNLGSPLCDYKKDKHGNDVNGWKGWWWWKCWFEKKCSNEEMAQEEIARICSNLSRIKLAIKYLVKADYLIAKVAYNDALTFNVSHVNNTNEYQFHLKMAKRYMLRGDREALEGKPFRAITDYKTSWKNSVLAVKWALKDYDDMNGTEDPGEKQIWPGVDPDCHGLCIGLGCGEAWYKGPWWLWWYIKQDCDKWRWKGVDDDDFEDKWIHPGYKQVCNKMFIAWEDYHSDYDYNDWAMYMHEKKLVNKWSGDIKGMKMKFIAKSNEAGFKHYIHMKVDIAESVEYSWTMKFYDDEDNLLKKKSKDKDYGVFDEIIFDTSQFRFKHNLDPYYVTLEIIFFEDASPSLIGNAPYDAYMYVRDTGREIHKSTTRPTSNHEAKGSSPSLAGKYVPMMLVVDDPNFEPPYDKVRIWTIYNKFDDWVVNGWPPAEKWWL